MFVKVSRIIGELDTVIDSMRTLRRELLLGQQNEAVMDKIREQDKTYREQQDAALANQHGDNPMGKDGEPR